MTKSYHSAILIPYKTITIRVTEYYSTSKSSYIATLSAENPAGGKSLQCEVRVPVHGREDLLRHFNTPAGKEQLELLYAKYAQTLVDTFPSQIVSGSCWETYQILMSTKDFQDVLVSDWEKSNKLSSSSKKRRPYRDTLNPTLVETYLRAYGAHPLSEIDAASAKSVKSMLAKTDPRFVSKTLCRLYHRLELMQHYVASCGWIAPTPLHKSRRWDASAQKRHKMGDQCLSQAVFITLLQIIMEEVPHDGRALGVLAILLEGLSPQEACALQYGDIITLSDYGDYSLRVTRPHLVFVSGRMDFGIKNPLPTSLRNVPLCSPMIQALIKRYQTAPADLKMSRLPIVCYENNWQRACQPEELNAYSKALMTKAGFQAGFFTTVDEKSDHQTQKDISPRVLILQRTFSQIARAGKMRAGEIDHMLGRAQQTTLGAVYRDYQCGQYQERLKRCLDEGVKIYGNFIENKAC